MSKFFSSLFSKRNYKHNYLLHISLFIITFITTILAGLMWTTGQLGPYELKEIINGLPYALCILIFLAAHEFGHFFASVYHKVKVSLPYFIPFPPIIDFINFGTIGAVIKTKSPVPNNKAMFDIGIAGPLAGFAVCIIILIYGFTHLPAVDYLLKIHPEYYSPDYGKNSYSLIFGDSLVFYFLKTIFTNSAQFIPPMSEIYHYPFLCVGWFGLFITSMNLIPVGQLDGGHIIYSMFGEKKQEAISSVAMIGLLFLGILGLLTAFLNINIDFGWSGWLFWAMVLYFLIKIKHPPVQQFEELDFKRKVLGYLGIIVFIISFSPAPFIITLQ
jgi:membrane-associated protease RseP (regulator of RpoE activity)